MTYKKYFAALIINQSNESISLGHAELSVIEQRANHQIDKFTRESGQSINSAQIHFAETKEQLESLKAPKSPDSKPELSWSEQWALDNPDLITPIEEVESPIPGVSLEYWLERRNSPIYDTWNLFCCFPDKRIGVPQSVIDEARDSWFKHAPEIAPYFPKWVT